MTEAPDRIQVVVPEASAPKLNLFVLPSQTTLLFGGILLVVGLPLLLTLTSRYGIRFPLLPVVVFVFTLWDFLSEPTRVRTQLVAEMLPASAVALQQRVAALAQAVGAPLPELLVARQPLAAPRVFGTWRQRYLIFPSWLVEEAPRYLSDAPQSAYLDIVLRHELAHFVNQDVWLTTLARSLLKMTVTVLLVYWFTLLWEPLVYRALLPVWSQVAPSYAPLIALLPAQLQPLLWNPPEPTWTEVFAGWLELSMALLPLVGGALFLWRRDWNLLLQVREVYADARVAKWLGETRTLERALDWFRMQSATSLATATPGVRPMRKMAVSYPLSWALDLPLRSVWRTTPQPKANTRRQVLRFPELVYGEPAAIGRRAGVIVLLFYLIGASLLGLIREGIGAEVAIGFGFVVLALGLTPSALVHMAEPRVCHRAILRAVGWYLVVFNSVVTTMVAIAFMAVLVRPHDLDLVIYAIAGVSPAADNWRMSDPTGYMVQVALGTLVIFYMAGPLLLYGALRLDLAIKRRMLAWSGASWLARRTHLLFGGVTLTLSVSLGFVVLPFLTAVAFPLILGLEQLNWGVLGVAAVSIALIGLLFWRADRRYGLRCSRCGQATPYPAALDVACPHCGAKLLDWLIAPY